MRTVALLLLCAASSQAVAGSIAIPEPGTVELLSIGAIAALVILVRNRRK